MELHKEIDLLRDLLNYTLQIKVLKQFFNIEDLFWLQENTSVKEPSLNFLESEELFCHK